MARQSNMWVLLGLFVVNGMGVLFFYSGGSAAQQSPPPIAITYPSDGTIVTPERLLQ